MTRTRRARVKTGGRPVGSRASPTAAGAAATLALVALGCGDGAGGLGPGDRPAQLVRVSAAADTVVAGDRLDEPFTVRVEDASDRALAGVRVAFEVSSGPGSVEPDTTSTDAAGEARATFVAPDATGLARARASVPDAPDVDPVTFRVDVVPPGIVRLLKTGGDGQSAEPGSQLPAAFAVRTRAGDNEPVGGVRVIWALEEEPAVDEGAGAHLTADTVFTDADGRARVLLTLAEAEGRHRVRAVAPGRSDTVRFTADASTGAVGGVTLDSVRPVPLVAGRRATVFGSGFGGDPGTLSATVEGSEAPVLSVAADRVGIEVPALRGRCLPARRVGVRIRRGERLSNGLTVDLRPARSPMDLQVGEARTLTKPGGVACLQFAPGDGGREYRVQVQSAARTLARTPMRLVARTGPASGAVPPARAVGRRRAGAAPARRSRALASARELELRRNIRAELDRVGARPESHDPDGRARIRAAHDPGPPAVGDTLGINFYVREDLSVTCRDTLRRIGAEVRAVGDRAVLAEDTLARSADGFGDADYDGLRDELDTAIFAVDSAYFGPPSDIDHNDRVIVLITPEVNMLTPASSRARITGFFSPADLADSGDPEGGGTTAGGGCGTSNEAEILYLLAPDAEGRWGPEVTPGEALRIVRGTSAHEQQHLINAGVRLIREGGDFSDLPETWLDEGLSHVAEEVVGMRVRGTRPRQNLTFGQAGARSETYDAYFLQNLLRLSNYYANPSDARTLATSDPGGTESLQMRGFAWSFLRWLADTRIPEESGGVLGGPREEELFRALAWGGPELLTGVDNVLRAVETATGGRPAWRELMAEYAPVAHVDDDVEGVPERFTFPSWDLRDQYRGLGTTSGYPLRFTDAGFGTTAFDFEVRGSTQIYFRFGSADAAPSLSLRLASRMGGAVPASAVPQVTVVRAR